MPSKKPIRERIEAALGGRQVRYHDLAVSVFPPHLYPRAWRYASQGGPPGCYMALSAALRRYGFERGYRDGVWWVGPVPAARRPVAEGGEK